MLTQWRQALVCFAVLTGLPHGPLPGQGLSVSITEAKINGKPICGLPLDSVTTLLGRPSGVESNAVLASTVGPQLHYHRYGLSFWFQPKSKDPTQGTWILKIFLSRTWDSKFSEFYVPFPGQLVPAVSSDWRASQTEAAFAEQAITIRTSEEQKAQLQAAGVRNVGTLVHSVGVDFGTHRANFIHEPTTKFLESVAITCGTQ